VIKLDIPLRGKCRRRHRLRSCRSRCRLRR
jgi:hypothetical protein